MPPQPTRVLLTGASAGIGRHTALRLIADGCEVWGTARHADRLDGLDGLHPVELDLRCQTSIDRAIEQALAESGGFDVLINNAGYGVWGPLETTSRADERDQYQVLVFAPLRIIRAVLPGMRERRRGVVINVTSLAASFAVPFLGTYSACKAALAASTWSLQMELRGSAVRVVDVRPGDTHTEFHTAMEVAAERPHPRAPGVPAREAYADNERRAFAAYNRGMRTAPPPERVAELIASLVASGGGRRVIPGPAGYAAPAVGNFFQARVAPFLARFAPAAWVRWCTGRYFGLR